MNKIKLFLIIFLLSMISVFAQNKPYSKYKVQEGETIRSVCKKLLITPYKLLQLNPDIKDNDNLEGISILIIPNKNYRPTSTSGEHVDYVKDGFLYHKLLPKETYSKLKREYGVKKNQLRRFNSSLRFGGLKAGEIIKIPVSHDFKLPNTIGNNNVVNNDNTKPYLVKQKETKYSISRRYGISIEKLEALNPIIKDEGLKAESIILVPNTEAIPDESGEFVMHRVEKGDTFFNLGKRFGVSESVLIEENPDLEDGLKLNMLIKIPLSDESVEVYDIFTPSTLKGKELNVVYFLPFMSNRSAIDFETTGVDKTANIATDFYLGTSIAIDSLKSQGLSVNIKVFDTQNNKTAISSIFTTLDLNEVDVIIGPMFYDNLEMVAKLTRGRNIPIFSPVSKRDHSVINNRNLIQEMPLIDELSNRVLSHIEKNYNGENLVIIGDDAKESVASQNAIVSKLEALDTIKNVMLIKPEKGYIKPSIFREKLLKNMNNWIVLATNDAVVTRDVINNLGVLPEEYKTTFFALSKGENFEKQKDINNQLAHVNFHYPEYNFVDVENEDVKRFISKYKRINFADPSEFSFKGFDITYDALLRFASFSDVNGALKAGVSERMSTKFNYKINKANKGFINRGVYLIKYDGLNLVKVE